MNFMVYIVYKKGTSGGVMVSKLGLANLDEWVRVSLGAPFIRPCATSKKTDLVNLCKSTTKPQLCIPEKKLIRQPHPHRLYEILES